MKNIEDVHIFECISKKDDKHDGDSCIMSYYYNSKLYNFYSQNNNCLYIKKNEKNQLFYFIQKKLIYKICVRVIYFLNGH